MALLISAAPPMTLFNKRFMVRHLSTSPSKTKGVSWGFRVRAFFNPLEDPIFKDAVKEPVAFMGGVFAGLLRLDFNEDPLKEWITRTVEASGISVETEIDEEGPGVGREDEPQQIEIE